MYKSEEDFLRNYNKDEYEKLSLTTDILIFSISDNKTTNYRKLNEKLFSVLLVKRNTYSKEKIISRFKSDYKMLNEYNKYNYVVVNDNIKDATDKVESIIVASKCSVERIEDLDLDNQEELIHELLTM